MSENSTYIIPELRSMGVRTLSQPTGMSYEKYIDLQRVVAKEIDAVEKSKLIQSAQDEFQQFQVQQDQRLARSAV